MSDTDPSTATPPPGAGEPVAPASSDPTTETVNVVIPMSAPNLPLRMPSWVWKGILIFWLGFVATVFGRFLLQRLTGLLTLLLVSLFLALAIEPGVNRLAARGWKRGRATALILLGVLIVSPLGYLLIGPLGDLSDYAAGSIF